MTDPVYLAGLSVSTILLTMKRAAIFLLFILLLTVAGCELDDGSDPTPSSTEMPPIPTPADTPALESTPRTTPAITPPPRELTLTLWTGPDVAPDEELPGGDILAEQLNAFQSSHPDITLSVEVKTIVEQGGSLSYLRTGRSVAPSILPDVVLLPANRLADASSQGLIYPLDGQLSEEMIDDLIPAARELSHVDDRIFGYPFALTGLQHLIYNESVITETVSTNWTTLLSEPPAPFLLPAAGTAGAELPLHFYLANGGTLVNDTGQPALQEEPLTAALDEIRRGVDAGLIDRQSGSTASVEQTWQIFNSNPSYLIQTSAGYFLDQERADATRNYQALPLPGLQGPLPPTVNAWTWAITTPDPTRQALAAELIRWLGSSANVGEWTLESNTLPARQSSFEVWPESEYMNFLQRQLSAAAPAPRGANNNMLSALSRAASNVILGLSSPEEAAAEAVEALQP
ncbi:MAG TPA: extracellular solute-binding protein [Candidatus Sulfomarinibacteraceae bacterium]|nr:extracellular solute-binding protein [Candidatus Sulfomarinibacteraceae bacterium]